MQITDQQKFAEPGRFAPRARLETGELEPVQATGPARNGVWNSGAFE